MEIKNILEFKKLLCNVEPLEKRKVEKIAFITAMNSDKIQIRYVDFQQVSMLLLEKTKETTDNEIDTNLAFYLNELQNILSNVNKNDILSIEKTQDNKLKVKISNNTLEKEYTINTDSDYYSDSCMNLSETELIKIDYSDYIVIKAKDLKEALKTFDDIAAFEVINEQVIIREADETKVDITKAIKEKKLSNNFSVKFNVKYLKSVVNAINNNSDIKLYLKTNVPLKLITNICGDIEVRYYLAPIID
jgi:hypothetical protein